HYRVHPGQTSLVTVGVDGLALVTQQIDAVEQLRLDVRAVVTASHHHGGLHELVRDSGGQRVTECNEGLVRSHGRGSHADYELGLQVPDGSRERRSSVAVVLVSQNDEVIEPREVVEEGHAQVFQGHVCSTPLACSGRQGLNRKNVQLRDRRIIDRDSGGLRVEVVGRDDVRGGSQHMPQRLRVAGGEVEDRLVSNCPSGRQQQEVAYRGRSSGQVLHQSGHDVGLSHAGGRVHDALVWLTLLLHVVVVGRAENHRLDGLAVRLSQVETVGNLGQEVGLELQFPHQAVSLSVAASTVAVSAGSSVARGDGTTERPAPNGDLRADLRR